MAQKLTKDEVLALARLARLKLTEAEIEKYRDELTAILNYVEQLGNVDTEGLEPTSQVSGLTNVTRADKVKQQQATPDKLLAIVPRKSGRYIEVERMI